MMLETGASLARLSQIVKNNGIAFKGRAEGKVSNYIEDMKIDVTTKIRTLLIIE